MRLVWFDRTKEMVKFIHDAPIKQDNVKNQLNDKNKSSIF